MIVLFKLNKTKYHLVRKVNLLIHKRLITYILKQKRQLSNFTHEHYYGKYAIKRK